MHIEHKGYVLQQSTYNNHYMIFKDGRVQCHASCTAKLSKEEAIEAIERFIALTEKMHRTTLTIIVTTKETDNIIGLKEQIVSRIEDIVDVERVDVIGGEE